jgi:hypothetical protein
MPVGRFVQYTPAEFAQVYDPYPFEKMFQLAQYKQQRTDQMQALLGKAEAGLTVSPGLSRESRETAAQINKERKQQLDEIAMKVREGDTRNAMYSISKLQSEWASDPRVRFVESDRALSELILKNMAEPDYGTSTLYQKYDPNSREFVLGLTPEQISAGIAVNPEDYNLLSTPGQHESFKWLHEPLEAEINNSRELETRPDGKGSYYTYKGKAVTMDLISEKLLPSLQQLSSDGYNLDQYRQTDPTLAKHIEFKKAENGGNYFLPDLINDFYTDAQRYTYFQGNVDSAALSGGQQSVAPPAQPSRYSIFGDQQGHYSTTEIDIKDNELSSKIAEKGISGEGGFADFITGNTSNDAFVSWASQRGVLKSDWDAQSRATVRQELMEAAKKKLQPSANTGKYKIVNGVRVVEPVYSPTELEALASREVDAKMDALDNFRAIYAKSLNTLPKNVEIGDDGLPVMTPEEQAGQANMAESYGYIISNMLSTTGFKVGQVSPPSILLSSAETRDKWMKQYLPNIASVLNEDGSVDNMKLSNNIAKVQEELKKVTLNSDPSMSGVFNPQELLLSKNLPMSADHYADQYMKKENKARIKDTSRGRLFDQLDQDLKNAYGSRTFASRGINLKLKGTEKTDITANPLHQELADISVDRSRDSESAFVSIDGRSVENLEESIENNLPSSMTDDMKKQFMAGSTFNPKTLWFDFSGEGYKAYVRGNYEMTENGATYSTLKPFNIDVTDLVSQNRMFSADERARLSFMDGIADKLVTLDAAEYVQFLDKEKATDLGGSFEAHKNPNGTISLSGPVVVWKADSDGVEYGEVKNISELPSDQQMQFKNIPMSTAKEIIANALPDLEYFHSQTRLTEQSNELFIPPAYDNTVNAMISSGQIGSKKDIESFDNGLFGLNDRKFYQNNGGNIQQAVGFISSGESPKHPSAMSPEENMQLAARVVANTKESWNNWGVVRSDDPELKSNVSKLKAIAANYSPSLLSQKNRDVMRSIADTLDLDLSVVENTFNMFNDATMKGYRLSKGLQAPRSDYNASGLKDWMYAIAVMKATSGGDPSYMNANLNK